MSAISAAAAGVCALAATVGLGTAAYGVMDLHGTFRTESRPAVAASAPAGGSPAPQASSWSIVYGGTAAARPTPPAGSAPTSSTASRRASSAQSVQCPQGAYQRPVEAALTALDSYGTVVVDGIQSSGDCTAIRAFQQRFGIRPANGQADATTADVARRILASLDTSEQAKCGTRPGLTACVDLSLQTVWVVRDGTVVFGPTVARTGFRGHATPAGTYTVDRRALREWSNPYHVWLPYWQHFHNGMGFHEVTNYIHDPSGGSHGCVNLLPADAVKLWTLIGKGTTVRTFGRRSGT